MQTCVVLNHGFCGISINILRADYLPPPTLPDTGISLVVIVQFCRSCVLCVIFSKQIDCDIVLCKFGGSGVALGSKKERKRAKERKRETETSQRIEWVSEWVSERKRECERKQEKDREQEIERESWMNKEGINWVGWRELLNDKKERYYCKNRARETREHTERAPERARDI